MYHTGFVFKNTWGNPIFCTFSIHPNPNKATRPSSQKRFPRISGCRSPRLVLLSCSWFLSLVTLLPPAILPTVCKLQTSHSGSFLISQGSPSKAVGIADLIEDRRFACGFVVQKENPAADQRPSACHHD